MKGATFFNLYYRGKVMILHQSVILFTRGVSRGVSVWWGSLSRGSLCPGGLCPGCLCPGRSLSRWVAVWGVSVRGSLSLGDPPVRLHPEVSILLDCLLGVNMSGALNFLSSHLKTLSFYRFCVRLNLLRPIHTERKRSKNNLEIK